MHRLILNLIVLFLFCLPGAFLLCLLSLRELTRQFSEERGKAESLLPSRLPLSMRTPTRQSLLRVHCEGDTPGPQSKVGVADIPAVPQLFLHAPVPITLLSHTGKRQSPACSPSSSLRISSVTSRSAFLPGKVLLVSVQSLPSSRRHFPSP